MAPAGFRHGVMADAHTLPFSPMTLVNGTWLAGLRAQIGHAAMLKQVEDEANCKGRYLFMVVVSAGIAMLGLLLSSPAVVIGAMPLSLLMGPILGLGFGLAVFDLAAMRQSPIALALGIAVAVGGDGNALDEHLAGRGAQVTRETGSGPASVRWVVPASDEAPVSGTTDSRNPA